MVSIYYGSPSLAHWIAVKNILKHVQKTKDTILVFGGKDELKVSGYSDANFLTDRDSSYS